MDIKDLNKPQLILLALLLSFVTSLATGITTVALMDQAPTSVTVPINRIIRQTVEKIVPTDSGKQAQTIVVKEEDLVVDAIAKNQSSIFTITKNSIDDAGAVTEVSAGRGFAVAADGTIVADSVLASDTAGTYFVKNDSGKFKADFVSTKDGFSFLKIGAPLDEKNKLIFTVPTFGDISKMKIGQKVIVLGGNVSSFIYAGSKDLNLNVTKSNAGGIVLDLDGDVLGVALSGDNSSFAPISAIIDALKLVPVSVAEVPKL